MTIETKIKFQDIVENQVPRFVRDDFPLLPDFLKLYYSSQEVPGGTLDLIQNLDRYVKVDELYGLKLMHFEWRPFSDSKYHQNTSCR